MEKHPDYQSFEDAVLNLTNGNPSIGRGGLPFAYAAALGEPILEVRLDTTANNGEGRLDITFPSGAIQLWDDGRSCCEHRYMTTDDDLSSFVGAKLLGVDMVHAEGDNEHGEPHEQVFVKIETTMGTITCVTHNEHNGYYGGFSIQASWEEANGSNA